MLYTRKSMFTGKQNVMDLPITPQRLMAWMESGQMIQDWFPDLSAAEREFLLNGVTPEEWQTFIGEPEADDELPME